MSLFAVAGWISLGLWLLVEAPIAVYGVYIFWWHRNETAIQKRCLWITMLTFVYGLLHLTVDRGLFLIEMLSMTRWPFIHVISSALHPLIWYGLVFGLLGRFWIIRYNIECVLAQCDNEWRSVINNECDQEENWYIRNKGTFGNGKFIFSRFIAPVYLVCTIGSIFVHQFVIAEDTSVHYYVHQFVIDNCVTALPFFCMAFLWCKTSDIGDTLWMRREQFFVFVTFMVGVVANLSLGLCAAFLVRFPNDVVVLSVIESHVRAAVSFLIIAIMTYGVLSQNNYALRATAAVQMFLTEHGKLSKGESRLSLSDKISNGRPSPISLKATLSDHIMFHAFMNHLASEFSMESLLSVVEFVQYKAYLLANFRDYLSSRHDYKTDMIELPKDLPQSSIVFGSRHSASSEHTAAAAAPDVPCTLTDVPSLTSVADNTSNSMNANMAPNRSGSGSGGHRRPRRKSHGGGLYDSLRPFRTKAQSLYDKYIREGAVYEINISGEMKLEFARLLENEQVWTIMFEHSNKNAAKMQAEKMISEKLHEIIELLNSTIDEMARLLQHSYGRFKTTVVYEKHMRRMSLVVQKAN